MVGILIRLINIGSELRMYVQVFNKRKMCIIFRQGFYKIGVFRLIAFCLLIKIDGSLVFRLRIQLVLPLVRFFRDP